MLNSKATERLDTGTEKALQKAPTEEPRQLLGVHSSNTEGGGTKSELVESAESSNAEKRIHEQLPRGNTGPGHGQ